MLKVKRGDSSRQTFEDALGAHSEALDDPSKVKCKARIVLLGYSDPGLGELFTSAPTITRRSRQLFLSMCTLKRWK